MNNRQREQKVYTAKYIEDCNYGRGTHGNGAYIFIEKTFHPTSILDVGCGKDNLFCGEIKNKLHFFNIKHNITKLEGCDFVDFPNSTQADINSLHYKDNEFDVVVSFDVLEHILPEDVDNALQEINRVAKKGMCFSIDYKQVSSGLHRTIQPEEWWIEKLSEFGKVGKYLKYLFVIK